VRGPSFIDADERRAAEALLGAVLSNRWRVTELLEVGGTSVVYGGEHRNGRAVAIKVLRAELAADPQIASRFLAEGRVANTIGHPSIVAILDDDRTEDGVPFLVMERLEGETLQRRLCERGPFHVLEVLVVADRVLDALEAAHRAGVLHRDLKPENIFLTRRGEIKLLDFGIARARDYPTPGGTMLGQVMGTPAFMSPEQARGQWTRVDERSDIFSLSAALFVLLTDRMPRDAETPHLELLAAMTQAFPKVREVNPNVPSRLAAVLDCGLSVEPEARWPSARAMRAAVRAAWLEATGAPFESTPGIDARPSAAPIADVRSATTDVVPRLRSRLRWLWPAAAAAMAVAVVVSVIPVGRRTAGEASDGAATSSSVAASAPRMSAAEPKRERASIRENAASAAVSQEAQSSSGPPPDAPRHDPATDVVTREAPKSASREPPTDAPRAEWAQSAPNVVSAPLAPAGEAAATHTSSGRRASAPSAAFPGVPAASRTYDPFAHRN
jgi:serine/threonine-protein kinase